MSLICQYSEEECYRDVSTTNLGDGANRVSRVSAAIIAVPLALQATTRQEATLLHDLFWPDSLDPYILFSLVFMGLVPVLLGYYHLGRLGFILSVALGFALAWVMAVLGIICFVGVGHYLRSVKLSIVAYVASVLLAYAHSAASFESRKFSINS
jgi:hypothetical protein